MVFDRYTCSGSLGDSRCAMIPVERNIAWWALLAIGGDEERLSGGYMVIPSDRFLTVYLQSFLIVL